MGTSIRDKAKRARSTKSGSEPESKAPAKTESKPSEPEPKATAPKAGTTTAVLDKDPAPTDREQVASVTDISDHVIDRMTEDEVEKFLAQAASSAGVAGLVATRETKTGQIQYDGKTSDGFVVRVWAPEGAPMIVKARLDVVE